MAPYDLLLVNCTLCNEVIMTCYLAYHMKSHANTDHVKCIIENCDVFSGNRSEMKNHVDTFHFDLGLQWCAECAVHVLDHEIHWKLQHEVQLPFNPIYSIYEGKLCGWLDCTYMAITPEHLDAHIKNTHELWVKCEECGKKVNDIEGHIRLNHATVKELPCEECDT